jgi:hypothetical protein
MAKWGSYNCLYLPTERKSVEGFLLVSFPILRLAHRWMDLSQYITVNKSPFLLIYKVTFTNMNIIFIRYSF